MTIREVTADLISSHDAFGAVFAEAAAAAVHLAADPRNPDSQAQCRCARLFLHMSLAHMAEEEASVFPEAVACGVSAEVVAQLYVDHDELRALSAVVDRHLSTQPFDEVGALALLRFVRGFEKHVQREEWSLAMVASC